MRHGFSKYFFRNEVSRQTVLMARRCAVLMMVRETARTVNDPDLPLVKQAHAGDKSTLGVLFGRHRERLRRLVDCRMDPRLRGRVDPSDVLQEAFLEASERFPQFLADSGQVPFFLWLRFLTTQQLALVHRVHLRVKARSVLKEMPAPAQSGILAERLLAAQTSPSQATIRAELKARLHQTLEQMDEADREVLALRHFEQLTNAETAAVLGIRESAASHRYARALLRLKAVLSEIGFGDSGGMR
jgi:RNA polymerase sigma-70 factor (ECF subfamily)